MYLKFIVTRVSNRSLYGISLIYTLFFYIDFSSSTLEQYDALLTSNIVPMYEAFRGRMQDFDYCRFDIAMTRA